MATTLSGSLAAFGLADVLRLLGLGSRTARIDVSGAQGTGWVQVVDGDVAAASSDVTRADLLRRVVAALSVGPEDLAGAVVQPAPVRALVDAGVVPADAVRDLAAEQVIDALSVLAGWRDGTFAVDLVGSDPGDLGVRLPVTEVIGAAERRGQEWDRVRDALPDATAVLSLAADPPQVPELTRDDWALLARVDGRRSVAEVLQVAGAGQLEVSERLAGLVSGGLLMLRAHDVEPEGALVGRLLDELEGPTRREVPGAARGSGERPGSERGTGADARSAAAASGVLVDDDAEVPDAAATGAERAPGLSLVAPVAVAAAAPVVVAPPIEPPVVPPAAHVAVALADRPDGMDRLPPVDEVRQAVAQALGLDLHAPAGSASSVPMVTPLEPLAMASLREEARDVRQSQPVALYGGADVGPRTRTRPAPIPLFADDSALLPGPRDALVLGGPEAGYDLLPGPFDLAGDLVPGPVDPGSPAPEAATDDAGLMPAATVGPEVAPVPAFTVAPVVGPVVAPVVAMPPLEVPGLADDLAADSAAVPAPADPTPVAGWAPAVDDELIAHLISGVRGL